MSRKSYLKSKQSVQPSRPYVLNNVGRFGFNSRYESLETILSIRHVYVVGRKLWLFRKSLSMSGRSVSLSTLSIWMSRQSFLPSTVFLNHRNVKRTGKSLPCRHNTTKTVWDVRQRKKIKGGRVFLMDTNGEDYADFIKLPGFLLITDYIKKWFK